MIYSMTGFGKAQLILRNTPLTMTIKTINSKQADVAMKFPPQLQVGEQLCRNLLSQQLIRGRIDLLVILERSSGGGEQLLCLDRQVFANYYREVEQALREVGSQESPYSSRMLSLPGVWIEQNVWAEPLTNEETDQLLEAVSQAIQEVEEFRKQEGAKLLALFEQNIATIQTLLQQTVQYEGVRVEEIRARLQEQLASLPEINYDPGRLEQELIYYIEKLDVAEEKNRLEHHLSYFLETAHSPEKATGKKLGFITQEIGREINTLGSKSNHAGMQRLVVEMKDQLEQIKEQVLNVL